MSPRSRKRHGAPLGVSADVTHLTIEPAGCKREGWDDHYDGPTWTHKTVRRAQAPTSSLMCSSTLYPTKQE